MYWNETEMEEYNNSLYTSVKQTQLTFSEKNRISVKTNVNN
jgi:hypothetical protein